MDNSLMTIKEITKMLSISRHLLSDLKGQLVRNSDFVYEQYKSAYNGKTGLEQMFYTQAGFKKVKGIIDKIDREKDIVLNTLFKLGYYRQCKGTINVCMINGAFLYLKEKGYKNNTIAYMLGKDRNTIRHTAKVIEDYTNDIITNSIIKAVIKELNKLGTKSVQEYK